MTSDFTQVPNKLVEVLITDKRLNSTDKSVLLFIMRQTIGFHRASSQISVRDFTNKTRYSYRSIQYSLQKLELMQYIALVNKGNSKLNFSEWRLGKLMQETAGDKTPQLMQNTARTHAISNRESVPVNKALNKAAASDDFSTSKELVSRFTKLLGDSYKFEENNHYRKTQKGWEKINHPKAYLKAVDKNQPKPAPDNQPLDAKNMSDDQLKDFFRGKTIGMTEGIDQGLVYEAIERGIL